MTTQNTDPEAARGKGNLHSIGARTRECIGVDRYTRSGGERPATQVGV